MTESPNLEGCIAAERAPMTFENGWWSSGARSVNHPFMMPTILSVSMVLSGCLILYWTARLEHEINSGKASPDPSIPPKSLRRGGVGLIVIGVLFFIAQFIVRRLEF